MRNDRAPFVILALSTLFIISLVSFPSVQPVHASGLTVDSHYYYDAGCTIGGDCQGSNCGGTANCKVTITTSNTNDVIVALFMANGGATFGANPISDGSGLTGTSRIGCGLGGG